MKSKVAIIKCEDYDLSKVKESIKKCIRCYCCQEVCPHKAIYVKKSLLNRFVK